MAARPAGPTDDAPRARPARWLSSLVAIGGAGALALGPAPADDAGDAPAAANAQHAEPSAELLEKRAQKARDTWWSWKPLEAPTPPEVRESAWVRTPVDRFVLAKLEAAGVEHAPEASREALVRRATFDLTQHELARLLLLEQLYRAMSIQQGGPYHRA